MGSNLFVDVHTAGLQKIRLLYQPNISHLYETEKQIIKKNVDIAGIIRHDSLATQLPFSDLNVSQRKDDKYLIFTPHKILRSGEVLLSQNNQAGFAEVNIDLKKIVFIAVDFSKSSLKEKQTALKNLAEFVNMQDNPVIVVGNFGIEAWAPDFLSFTDKTGLEVKNSVLLNNGKHLFNPFVVPTINVLAYKDFGISHMTFLPAKKNKIRPLLIDLNY
ncbi:MAG: hypothetical protein IJ660_04710 [Alphaproteobacteria bacterium]|nr:hypothetical protein [Alphaproteobacteria bacterium]